MNYKNKLMGLSLILLAAFSACTDDVENGGRDSGTDDHRITFAVGTESPDARTRADGSLPDAAGSYETNSVEMQGKLDGKNVYLTAEVSDGLPGDDQPLTRGTQVTGGAQVDEFSVSAAILDANVFEPETLDVMYNVKVAKDNASSTWTTGTPYYWPTGKKLTFFAWYPYNSKNLTIPKDNNVKDTKLFYEIPEQVADQEDFMMANSYEVSETSSVPIFFRHMLTAVKFKTSNNIPACTVKSISLKGVKYKGYHNWQAHNSIILSWNPDADTRDFTLDFPNGKEVAENTETELTGKGETFFMMPQTFGDDSEARLEVTLVMNGVEQTLSAKLKDIMANGYGYSYWAAGTTVTYKLSISKLSAEVTFFKGTNGTDGNPYTSHNISANGDPFTVDLKAPTSVNAITARLAYEVTDGDGNKTYEVFQDNLDLTGKTTADFTSPRMNNVGDGPGKAKKDATPFVVQIKVNSTAPITIPSDPDDLNTKRTYIPGTDENTWYTIWRGTMFPPNYIQDYNSDPKYVIVARKDGTFGPYDETESHEYWEVDKNHPVYGQGKWQIINPTWGTKLRLVYWIYELTQNGQCPGNNEVYGEPLQKKDGDIWYWISAAPTNDLTKCYLITGVGRNFAEMGQFVSDFQVGIDWKTTSHNFRYAILKSSL